MDVCHESMPLHSVCMQYENTAIDSTAKAAVLANPDFLTNSRFCKCPATRALTMLAPTGAIGSAEWSGVKLRDVLRFAGFDEDNSEGVAHVQFEGLDSDISGTCYGSSIPIDKAMGSHGDVLLAFSMNGRCTSCCEALSAC